MRQRVMIAMALACNPTLLIADEPTTALDVTIQAQVLEVMARLRREFGTAVIIITHNLGVVARYADRVNVMYAGRIIETARRRELYADPRHPYTLGLLNSVPRLDQADGRGSIPIEGLPPDLARLPAGLLVHPRCTFRVEKCRGETRRCSPAGEDGHYAPAGVDACRTRRPSPRPRGERRRDGRTATHTDAPPRTRDDSCSRSATSSRSTSR